MCPSPSLRLFGDLAYNATHCGENMPTHCGKSMHYIRWFDAEVTGEKLLPVVEAWFHWPGEFIGFDAPLEGFEPTCVAKPPLVVQGWHPLIWLHVF